MKGEKKQSFDNRGDCKVLVVKVLGNAHTHRHTHTHTDTHTEECMRYIVSCTFPPQGFA